MKKINLKCPQCGKKLTAEVDIGDDIWCPNCGKIIPIQDNSFKGKKKQISLNKSENVLIWICAILFGILVYYVIHSSGLKSRIRYLERANSTLLTEIKSMKSSVKELDIESDLQPAGLNFFYGNTNIEDIKKVILSDGRLLAGPSVDIMGEIVNKSGYDCSIVALSLSIYDPKGKIIAVEPIIVSNIVQNQLKTFKAHVDDMRSNQIAKFKIQVDEYLNKTEQ